MRSPIPRLIQQGTYIDDEESKYLDELSKALNVKRSKAVEMCIRHAIDSSYRRDTPVVKAGKLIVETAKLKKQKIELEAEYEVKLVKTKTALEIAEAWREKQKADDDAKNELELIEAQQKVSSVSGAARAVPRLTDQEQFALWVKRLDEPSAKWKEAAVEKLKELLEVHSEWTDDVPADKRHLLSEQGGSQ